ncbi:hypothetical protein, partial [Desulforegula conservatrix]|uniref:hypothetical protein n=1 Tax=Desulforegula conservatrix TaxID=153026 RepID=UPI001E2D3EE7
NLFQAIGRGATNEGESSTRPWDKACRTPVRRMRQLRDEVLSCGIQPAYIRLINRRLTCFASAYALDIMSIDATKKVDGRLLFS